ncbi:MAG: apiosidase-like domain-containing protein [Armatimonadota bacterium]
MLLEVARNVPTEWSFVSDKKYQDPFNEVEIDVRFTDAQGKAVVCPAYWAGESVWRVRSASSELGLHKFETICSDRDNTSLHGVNGEFTVVPYSGDNPLYKLGAVQVSSDHRYFEHKDGTPFFWLGDTWWMGFSSKLSWPSDFQTLTADRRAKGFNVVQIVAGLYPDMPPFDPRGANEGGFPWLEDYSGINPAYFDHADNRISHLVESGITPCIVGCWGYFMDFMGEENVRKHWRYLVARYGAYPVIWCAAGEALMPYYLHPLFNDRPRYEPPVRRAWTEVVRYIRDIDAFSRPITIHPIYMRSARQEVDDPSLLDFDLLQAGGAGLIQFPDSIRTLIAALDLEPRMPTFAGEVVYEGLGEGNRDDIQRLVFWACVLSGAKAHTYGANGIWQVNLGSDGHGASPHGGSYGGPSWEEAARYPGSGHMGIAKSLLEQYEWWRFEPHQDWIEIGASPAIYTEEAGRFFVPYAAGIPRQVRIIYLHTFVQLAPLLAVKELEADVRYDAFFFNPSTAERFDIGEVNPDENGNWQPPQPPVFRDWILVLESNSWRSSKCTC